MKKLFVLAALLLAACSDSGLDEDTPPSGRGGGTFTSPLIFPLPAGLHVVKGYNGISYHGGPIMLGTVNVYYIWYGNWAGNTAPSILEDLASHIGGSPYFNINTTYFDNGHNRISNSVSFLGSTTDNYSFGKSLNDANIASIVSNALTKNLLPTDTNAVYFVLASADVDETSGFCSNYCGWHTRATINGKDIKYSFVGNGDRCSDSCSPFSPSPNENTGADGMASVISHELEETVVDPDINAWYDKAGNETADKCAWTFGTTYTATGGSTANMKLGNRDYLIQRNWVNANGGYCALSY